MPSSHAVFNALVGKILDQADAANTIGVRSKVLLVRSTSYGDLATFLPYLAEVTSRFGREYVSLLLLSRHGEVGEALFGARGGIPMVTLDASRRARYPGELMRVRRALRDLRNDGAIFCGPSIDVPFNRLKRLLLVRTLVGIHTPIGGFALRHPVVNLFDARRSGGKDVINQARMPFVQTGITHTVDRAATLSLLQLSEAELKNAVDQLQPPLKFIGMHVGSRHERKRWPVDRFAELANRLLRDPAIGVVFLGGAEDLPAIENVIRGVQRRERVVVAAGRISIRETIALARHLTLCVGNDGAVSHLCALGGCPVVSIFCDWEPPGVWEPIMAPSSRSIRPTRDSQRRPSDFGIGAVTLGAVEAATRELLGGAGDHELIEIDGCGELRRRRMEGLSL